MTRETRAANESLAMFSKRILSHFYPRFFRERLLFFPEPPPPPSCFLSLKLLIVAPVMSRPMRPIVPPRDAPAFMGMGSIFFGFFLPPAATSPASRFT